MFLDNKESDADLQIAYVEFLLAKRKKEQEAAKRR